MSATFNYELFANYFSRSSVSGIEKVNVYEGTQARYDKEDEERKKREEQGWGPAKEHDWSKAPKNYDEDDDGWIEHKPVPKMPIKKQEDPAECVVINARCFQIHEYYIDDMIRNL